MTDISGRTRLKLDLFISLVKGVFSIFQHFINTSTISLFSAMAYVGLLLIALGTGGIKPCVASFGGEQFKVIFQLFISRKILNLKDASILFPM